MPAPYSATVDVDVTVRNYRCFSDIPARFELKKGLRSFVGVNNSGKSCLLRLFYELRNAFASFADPNTLRTAILGAPVPFTPMPMVKDQSEIFCDRNNGDLVLGFAFKGASPSRGTPVHVDRLEIVVPRGTNTFYVKLYKGGLVNIPVEQRVNHNVNQQNSMLYRQDPGNQTPIADLGEILELGRTLSRTLYLGPFRNAINVGGSDDYYDMQIGEPFIRSWRNLKTGYVKERCDAIYSLTDDIRRIFGFDRLDINASEDARNLRLMIDGKTYTQSEIGSGLIQFILVLANAAIKRPSFILIDEPELNLHPSLQIDFLTALASHAEHGVLFATHNLGLARAVSDSVYSVRRNGLEREVREFTGTRALAEFLGELGFNAYQDMGFETVLLVEGPTDVTCVQQFLRILGKEGKIVLLPLGGKSLINANCEVHLSEIQRISKDVRALIDSERDGAEGALDGPRQAFVDSCGKLKIPCHVLERRAIENYLSGQAIASFKGQKYRALEPYEPLKNAQPSWGKEENWRIAKLMTREEIAGTDLGNFLEGL